MLFRSHLAAKRQRRPKRYSDWQRVPLVYPRLWRLFMLQLAGGAGFPVDEFRVAAAPDGSEATATYIDFLAPAQARIHASRTACTAFFAVAAPKP